MKKILLLCGMLAWTLSAAQIKGKVFDKADGKGLPGIIVSDGTNLVKTGADGSYTLETGGKRAYVMIHESSDIRADKRFVKLEKGKDVYDFPVKKVPVKKEITFLHFGDPETQNMEIWTDDVIELGKNLNIDFMLNGGDICNLHGMNAHAQRFKADELPFDLFYVVGNHDINKPEPGAYERLIGPYWYSFERSGVLFVAAPMHYGDIGNMRKSHTSQYARPYTLEEFGSYLEKLLALFPKDQPKFFLMHGTPSTSAFDVNYTTENGKEIRLAQYNVQALALAHSHHNMVMRSTGCHTVYRTGQPNMSGEDWNPAGVRILKYDGKKWSSFLVWSGQHKVLSLQSAKGENGVTLSAIAYDSSDPVKSVSLKVNGKDIELQAASALAYQAQTDLADGEYQGILTAKSISGKEFQKAVNLKIVKAAAPAEVTEKWENFLGNAEHHGFYPAKETGLYKEMAFIAHTKSEILMASPVVTNGKVFTATIDNGDSFNGGIYAFDAKTGKKLWARRTRNSIPNSLAAADGKVFVQDLRGKVYALYADSGKVAWTEHTYCSDYRIMTAGLVYSNGKVFAGSRDTLHAIDAKTGKVIWRNPARSFDTGTVNTITVGGGIVCTGVQGEGFYAFDEKTGKMLWKKERKEYGGQSASAVYVDGKFYVKGTNTVFVVDPKTGNILAERNLGDRLYSSPMPLLVTDKLIIAGAKDGNIHALDKNTLKTLWLLPLTGNAMMKTGPYNTWNRPRGNIAAGAVIRGNIMYYTNTDGFLYMIDVDTGKTVHKAELGIPGFSAPAFANGAMFVTDFAGRLFRFNRK